MCKEVKLCRHCKDPITSGNRKWCLKPECQEAKKVYNRELERNRLRNGAERKARKAPAKDIPIDKQWPCKECGKLSTNRLYCPTCRKHMLKLAGRVDGDWKYFTTIYHSRV